MGRTKSQTHYMSKNLHQSRRYTTGAKAPAWKARYLVGPLVENVENSFCLAPECHALISSVKRPIRMQTLTVTINYSFVALFIPFRREWSFHRSRSGNTVLGIVLSPRTTEYDSFLFPQYKRLMRIYQDSLTCERLSGNAAFGTKRNATNYIVVYWAGYFIFGCYI